MKFLFYIATVVIFTFSLSAYKMGDFVRDVVIKPLIFSFPEMIKETASDGTEILSLPNADFPFVYAEFHIYYGRKNLGNRRPELTKLLADSWEYSGSKSYPKDTLLQEFEKLGATFGLSIGYDKTIIALSYMKKDELRVIALLQSFWKEYNIDPEVVSTIRGKVSDEINRRNDNPTSLGIRKLKERVFRDTIQGKITTLDGLTSIKLEDLIDFQKEILSEKKRILLLTGDADILAWKKYVTDLTILNFPQTASEEILNSTLLKNLEQIKTNHLIVEKDISQAFVVMMGSLPKHNDPDFFAVQVLNYIIGGGGFNSYYMREIRNNRGLAYSAGSEVDFQKGYGTINFYAMTKTESVPQVLGLMKDLLKKDFIASLKPEELERAKVAITNQFVFLFDDSKKVLQNELRFRDHEMPKDYLTHFRENIEKVSLDDLRRVGETYFQPENLSVLVVGPKSVKESLGTSFQLIQPEETSP